MIDLLAARGNTEGLRAVLIGLTIEDMYNRDRPDWRFSFSIRHPSGLAVVSRARMDPHRLGLFPDSALRTRRLQKMVMKNVGILSLGLRQSRNPRSAVFDLILGTDDLDYMTEHFRPPAPSSAKRAWLAGSTRVCKQGIAQGKALIARTPLVTREDLLALVDKSIALEELHRAQLAALPAPAEERSALRAMLARFKRVNDADRAALATLSARWNETTAKRWIQDGFRYSLALKSDALELGSRSCAQYFDPATYAR
ncbi:MAG: hypothetical protein H0U08_07555 [Actinobacteria bacterium]|nr:hypothetical protein [Actinomycetota bacterium]